MDFENKYIENLCVHYSRIIASWIKVGGHLMTGKDIDIFREWLESTDALTTEQIEDIIFLARNGKLEWEANAKLFLKNIKK